MLSCIPQKSQLAQNIRDTLAHWAGMIQVLDDDILELDANPVEKQNCPIALTRKNAFFPGTEISADNRALIASLIATCKMAGVNPADDIADTLCAILYRPPRSRINDLMPWRHTQPSSPAR